MAEPVASPGPGGWQDQPTAPPDRRWLVLAVVAVAQLMVVHQVTSTLHPAVKVLPVGLLCCSPVIDPGLSPAPAGPSR
jgi:hypothetical protein